MKLCHGWYMYTKKAFLIFYHDAWVLKVRSSETGVKLCHGRYMYTKKAVLILYHGAWVLKVRSRETG